MLVGASKSTKDAANLTFRTCSRFPAHASRSRSCDASFVAPAIAACVPSSTGMLCTRNFPPSGYSPPAAWSKMDLTHELCTLMLTSALPPGATTPWDGRTRYILGFVVFVLYTKGRASSFRSSSRAKMP